MRLAIFGAGGRMGRTIARLASDEGVRIVGAVDAPASAAIGRDIGDLAGIGHAGVEVSEDLGSALLGADVLIDFTIAAAFDNMLRQAMKARVAVVSGTTRLGEESHALIDKASKEIPVMWAPNMSVGVHVLGELVEQAVRALGHYDIEIVETHHNQKADAPSGTATFLRQKAEAARPGLEPVFGREGQPGARRQGEIGMHALRGGGVFGDHTVHLIGAHDRLSITHRAISRDLFAAGALRAARFIAGKPAGRYHLADTLDGPSGSTTSSLENK